MPASREEARSVEERVTDRRRTNTMNVAINQTTARLSEDGEKIILRGYSSELLEFYRSLPNARFDRASKTWSCLATPAAVWRIYSREEFVNSMAGALEAMAEEFHKQITRGCAIVNSPHVFDAEQPPIHKTKAWAHQRLAYQFAENMPATLLALDMGCGKSKVAIDLIVNWGCRLILILCPTSVRDVWRRECKQHADELHTEILDKGTVAKKRVQAGNFAGWLASANRRGAIVINYESAWRSPFAEWALGLQWDCVILDESHRVKSPNGKISRFCGKLGRRAKHRLLLTGTPMPHSPLDLFAQFKVLDPGLFGTSYAQFRQHFAVCSNPTIPQKVTGFKNQAELHRKYKLLSYRVEATDVLDLPPVQHDRRTFQLGKDGQKAYDEMEQELITEVQGGVVTAANALVKLLRLQQVTSGYLPEDETKRAHCVDYGKVNLLEDILQDIEPTEPVIVFGWFRQDLYRIAEVAGRLGRIYGELSGDRKDLTSEATMPANVDVLAVQARSGGVGIDLTRARYAICYSLGCISPGDYDQLVARIVRPGQRRPVMFYHLLAKGTVDARMYRARERRQNVIDAVLDGFTQGEGV